MSRQKRVSWSEFLQGHPAWGIGCVYAIGVLVTAMHLGRYGVHDLAIARIRYLFTGAVLIYFLFLRLFFTAVIVDWPIFFALVKATFKIASDASGRLLAANLRIYPHRVHWFQRVETVGGGVLGSMMAFALLVLAFNMPVLVFLGFLDPTAMTLSDPWSTILGLQTSYWFVFLLKRPLEASELTKRFWIFLVTGLVLLDIRCKNGTHQLQVFVTKRVGRSPFEKLVDRRTQVDPLAHLSKLNVSTDRRHDRRALSSLEFDLLIAAAQSGRTIESIPGPDRAMMYILAAWTGFRKGEIGSLTGRSLQLDTEPSTATVAACFSKRKREDTQILHPEVASMLKKWIAKRTSQTPDDLLFPVSGKVPGGKERKTHKMIQRDLRAARDRWIEDAETDADKERRLESDILKYCDNNGRFADFHSNRHLFITSLERANLSPKMAQTLARHSDVRLTLGVYTHVGLHDQTAAIHSLPAPPSIDAAERAESVPLRATKR